MKRIWIVSTFDNLPMEGYRAQRFWLMARAFRDAGWLVTYWTSSWSHANKAPRVLKGSGERLAEGVYEGIRLRLLEAPSYTRNISLRRFWSHRVLAQRFAGESAMESKPDLVVVASPTLGLPRVVREQGLKYIVDVMDAWPETFERVAPRFFLAPLRSVARANYLGAAGISVVAKRYEDLVRGYGFKGSVAEFLHGIERVEKDGAHPLPPRTEELKLVYAGNMSLSYDLETLIKAVQGMARVTLDLAGDGPDRARLEKLASSTEGKNSIRFLGYLGAEELGDLLVQGDAGVIPMFTASCVGVPYKLADYAVAGLPVLNSLEGETADLLSQYQAGFSYKAGDVQSLQNAIRALRSSNRASLIRGAQNLADTLDAKHIYSDYVKWATLLAFEGKDVV